MTNELTPHIEYYDNGNVYDKGQKNSLGQREGIWEGFYENGNIHSRTPYKGGKKDGIDEEFYENGNIESRTPFKEGKEDGIVEWFYENGNIYLRTPYKGGKKDGIAEWFDKQGNITKTTLWKNGELIEELNTKPMTHPEKWYIPVTEENHEELQAWWRKQVLKSGWTSDPEAYLLHGSLLLSQHPKDDTYYYSGPVSNLKTHDPSYQGITLEQFRQITNSQPMKHPEYWCIEATKENFVELHAWWEKNADAEYNFHFRVGYTLMSEHPHDKSKYYGGTVKACTHEYPRFVEITLEQFREITNSTQPQTTMTKHIQISRELLNEYYEAATSPQKAYLSEHFKLDGRTTDEAIRGLHDMACAIWKPRIKKNHPDCFPEDSKYFDFTEHVRNKSLYIVPKEVCHSLGLEENFIQVRNSSNPETHNRSFFLSSNYKWELKFDGGAMVLIPTKKS